MSSYAVRRAGARNATRAAARYSAEAEALRAETTRLARMAWSEIMAEQQAADAAAPRDLTLLAPGVQFRTRHGWYTVVKVNRVSVLATGGFIGRELIALNKIVEVRPCGS